jgi:hypothetical protein
VNGVDTTIWVKPTDGSMWGHARAEAARIADDALGGAHHHMG